MRPLHSLPLLVLLALLSGCAAGGATSPPPAPPPSPSATRPPLPTATPPAAAPTAPAAGAAYGEPVSLVVGATAMVGQVALTLTAVENDSRCPTGVTCVWEGSADALIALDIAGRGRETATLTIYGQGRESDESWAEVGGHTVRLTGLEPYPADPQPIPQGDYVATFVVEEGGRAYAPVGGGAFDGVIVPERDAPALDPRAEGYWTPAEADVLALETGLAAFLQRSPPQSSPELWRKQPGYKRQYAGLIRDGRRLVHASFFCDTLGEDWRREVLFVLDGGDCFFQLTYDVEGGAYGDLLVNGES